jgi:hypothetical protein
LSCAGRDPELETADALRDLRTGVNIFGLQEAHFRALARGPRRPMAPALLASVDGVTGDLLVAGSVSARHKGLAAAVGSRRNLDPDAPPYVGEPSRPA